MTTFLFVLSLLGKAGYQFQIADDAGSVIKILTVTDRTFHKAVFADVSASFAQGVENIEGKEAAACFDCGIQQQQVLVFGQMLVKIDMTSTAAIKISGKSSAMQHELVQYADFRIFGAEKVGIVTVAGNKQLFGLIPHSILDAEILRGHHFRIPEDTVALCSSVGFIDWLQDGFSIGNVVHICGIDVNSKRLSSLNESVDTYRQVLLLQIDETCIVDRQEAGIFAFMQDLIECQQVSVFSQLLVHHPSRNPRSHFERDG